MLITHFSDGWLAVLVRLNGLRGLKKAEHQSMTMRDPGGPKWWFCDTCGRIRENARLTVHEISGEVGVFYGMVQVILEEDFIMQRFTAKFVSRVLGIEQENTASLSPSISFKRQKRIRTSRTAS